MLSIEQVKDILANIDTEWAEDDEVELDGVKYYLSEKENEGWKSEGKWETNYYIYELVCNDGNKTNPTGIFIGQGRSRSGSYYSEYYYEFENLEIVEQVEETIVVKKWVRVNK